MKGYVALTNDDINLFSKAVEVIDDFTPNLKRFVSIKGLGKLSIK